MYEIFEMNDDDDIFIELAAEKIERENFSIRKEMQINSEKHGST